MVRSFEEIYFELKSMENCEHEFNETPVAVSAIGRFGGDCVNIYRCNKCAYECFKEEEYEALKDNYDDSGRIKE